MWEKQTQFSYHSGLHFVKRNCGHRKQDGLPEKPRQEPLVLPERDRPDDRGRLADDDGRDGPNSILLNGLHVLFQNPLSLAPLLVIVEKPIHVEPDPPGHLDDLLCDADVHPF